MTQTTRPSSADAMEAFLAPMTAHFLTRDTRVIHGSGWHQVITPSVKEAWRNEVVYSILTEADVDRVIRETIDQYHSQGLPFRWSLGPLTQPTNMAEHLEHYGFQGRPVRGMVMQTSQLPPHAPDEILTLEEVNEDNKEEFLQAHLKGWGPGFDREELEWALRERRGRFYFYLARVKDEVVGVSSFVLNNRSAYLGGGLILEPHRGRGYYRALTMARLEKIRSLGRQLVVTQAWADSSAPVLEKMGFQTAYRSQVFELKPRR